MDYEIISKKSSTHRNHKPKLDIFNRRSIKRKTYLNLGHSKKKKKKILQILNGHRQHDNAVQETKMKCLIQTEENSSITVLCNCQGMSTIRKNFQEGHKTACESVERGTLAVFSQIRDHIRFAVEPLKLHGPGLLPSESPIQPHWDATDLSEASADVL